MTALAFQHPTTRRRVGDEFRAFHWARKNPLRHASHKDERAMRFQRWFDESVFSHRATITMAVWHEYQRQLQMFRGR